MGKQKHLNRVITLLKKSPVVKFTSIKKIVKAGSGSKEYAKQLIRNLVKKGKVNRITKGAYSIHDDPSLLVFCLEPAYLGLQNALSFHELWEQETIPVIITGRKARNGIRTVSNTNVLVRRAKREYLFGYEYFKQSNFYFPYSDIEKTLVDMVYFGENLSKTTLKNIRKRINRRKLKRYLKHYPKKVRRAVLSKLNS